MKKYPKATVNERECEGLIEFTISGDSYLQVVEAIARYARSFPEDKYHTSWGKLIDKGEGSWMCRGFRYPHACL